jgi:hypothetical protein
MTEEQLCALLRLKRFEQPPPQYFEELLRDIHQRQRSELLRRPLWRIAVDRVQTAFSEHSMGGLSYAGAMTAALVLGLGGIFFLTPADIERHNAVPIAAASSRKIQEPAFSLDSRTASPLEAQPFPTAQSARGESRFPRYVIDARPASYEPSFKF